MVLPIVVLASREEQNKYKYDKALALGKLCETIIQKDYHESGEADPRVYESKLGISWGLIHTFLKTLEPSATGQINPISSNTGENGRTKNDTSISRKSSEFFIPNRDIAHAAEIWEQTQWIKEDRSSSPIRLYKSGILGKGQALKN